MSIYIPPPPHNQLLWVKIIKNYEIIMMVHEPTYWANGRVGKLRSTKVPDKKASQV